MVSAPQIPVGHAFPGLRAKVIVNLLQPLQGQTATGLAVGAVPIRGQPPARMLTARLGLPLVYQHLRQKVSQIGWIALGSLVERNKPGQGGPRYQWSRRIGPKTVTVALSAQQFNWLKQAVSNQREVWDILLQLEQLTAQHALENIAGPRRRKRLSKNRLGLN